MVKNISIMDETRKNPDNFIHSFTGYVNKDLRSEIIDKMSYVLQFFPKLSGEFKVGYTDSYNGVAVGSKSNQEYDYYIRLTDNVSLYTIAHEFTHLIQRKTQIPSGERQCDIWTIARTPKYLDSPPTYLEIPISIKENWNKYNTQIHKIGKKAIKKRDKGKHAYIKWFENEIKDIKKI